MQLQVLDESVRFDCGSCGACCDQPWRTMIEEDKAVALDLHDWSRFPQLSGKRFYSVPRDGRAGYFDLAKGEGTRCLFLDTDGLCIIHKELGPQAKPNMCLQFPFFSSRTWTEDRVSANFGCPSIQNAKGRLLAAHAGDIANIVPRTQREPKPTAPVKFDLRLQLTQSENDALMDRLMRLFEQEKGSDVWSAFAAVLAVLEKVREAKLSDGTLFTESKGLIESLRSHEPFGEISEPVSGYLKPSQTPMAARVLFAATLFPDTLPADAAGGLGFFKRMLLMPRLFSLATLSGTYASRLLRRNVSIRTAFAEGVAQTLDKDASGLLFDYLRSRLWQRAIAGTKLPIVGGIHQHILDLNAILFLARAEAARLGEKTLSHKRISEALTQVEFHLANQRRLYDQVLKGWLRANLCSLDLARTSLTLLAPTGVPQPIASTRPGELNIEN